jgi:hypothetical protein
MKKINLSDNLLYVTDKHWQFGMGENDEMHQFGIIFETIDMLEATGEKEFKQYPFLVSAEIMADNPHVSFDETGGNPDKTSLLYDCKSYMGGIPIDHELVNAVRNSKEKSGEAFNLVADQLSANEACVIITSPKFGTIAAQKGPGSEHKYLQFKTEEACQKFIAYILKHRISAMRMMIGFTLDKPINMIGDSGWSVMENQVNGCK